MSVKQSEVTEVIQEFAMNSFSESSDEESLDLTRDEEIHFRYEPPNGGYAWFISVGAAIVNSFNFALTSVFGLLFGIQLKSQKRTTFEVVLILNLNILIINLLGIVTKYLMKSCSTRPVAIFGVTLTLLGLVISSNTEEYSNILLGYSVLVGLGQGLIATSTITAINSFFTTKRRKANEIMLAGISIGQIMLPLFVGYLLVHVEYETAVYITALLVFMGITGAFLFQPVKQYMRIIIIEDLNLIQHKPRQLSEQKFTIFTFCSFACMLFGLGIVYMVNISFITLLPLYLNESIMLSKEEIGLCLAFLACLEFSSRSLYPLVARKLKLSSREVFLFGLSMMSLMRLALTFAKNFHGVLIMCGIYGSFQALTVTNLNVIIKRYCSNHHPEKFQHILILFLLVKGVCIIAFGQLLGLISDISGNYKVSFNVQNIFILIYFIFWLIAILLKKFSK